MSLFLPAVVLVPAQAESLQWSQAPDHRTTITSAGISDNFSSITAIKHSYKFIINSGISGFVFKETYLYKEMVFEALTVKDDN